MISWGKSYFLFERGPCENLLVGAIGLHDSLKVDLYRRTSIMKKRFEDCLSLTLHRPQENWYEV